MRTLFATFLLVLMGLFAAVGPAFAQVQQSTEQATLRYPDELLLFASAVGLRLKGDMATLDQAPVMLLDPALQGIDSSGLGSLRGFGLDQLHVGTLEKSPRGGKNLFAAHGLLQYANDDGRRMTVDYTVEYGSAAKLMIISFVHLKLMSPPLPEPLMFVVPAESYVPPKRYGNYLDAMIGVGRAALDLTQPDALPSGIRSYKVVAFVPDRLPADAQLDYRVSATGPGEDGFPFPSEVANFNGWRVVTLDAEFAFGDGPETFVKLVYTPGSDTAKPLGLPRLVGLLSNYPGR